MSIAERLLTGGLSTVCTGIAMGGGAGIQECIKDAFRRAANPHSTTGDVVVDLAFAVGVAGLTLVAAAGAVFLGKQTIHPE